MDDASNMDAAKRAAQEALGQGSPTSGTSEMDTIRNALAVLDRGLPQDIITAVGYTKTVSIQPHVARAEHRLQAADPEVTEDKHELVTRALQNLSTADVSVPLFQEIQALRRIALDVAVTAGNIDAATVAYSEALNAVYQTIRVEDGRGKSTQQAKAVQPPLPPK